MKLHNKIFLVISSIFLSAGLISCVDDVIDPEGWDKNLPEELKDNYSITFRMSLDPMGGAEFRSRATSDLRDVEDFVDLEKVRVFFFTCQYGPDDKETYDEGGKTYDTGTHDYFLFESSSRWISSMASSSFNASKLWQITTPIFAYGNQDKEYNWERIRYALSNYDFKIVILANRPPGQRFADYDGTLENKGDKEDKEDPEEEEEKFMFDNQGPYWTYKDSWANQEGDDYSKVPTINDFHHCQWDPVYASKNSINGISGTTSTTSNGNNVYDFIMENPEQTADSVYDGKKVNQMGTVSQWTQRVQDYRELRVNFTDNSGKKEMGKEGWTNYYYHPKRNDPSIGGIPMYGVQKFEP